MTALTRPVLVRRSLAARASTSWLLTAAVSIVLLVGWQLAADGGLTRLGVISSPLAIVESLVTKPELYATAFGATAWVAVRGWFWGNLVAIVLAVLFVQFVAVERLLLRLALTLFCLPLVAVMPLLQLTFPPDTARVVLAALSVFFTTLVGTVLGLRSAEGSSLTMIRAWGGGPLAGLRFVRLRSGLPAILTGFQIGAAASVLGAVFGEFIGAERGLGVLLINGMITLDLSRVWSVAVLATLMAAVPYGLFALLSRWLVPWSTSLAPPSPVMPKPGRSPLRVIASGVLWTLGSLAVIIAAWYAYLIVFRVSPFVGKTPLEVVAYVFRGDTAAENQAALLEALGATLVHAGVGYVAGLLFGVLFSVLFVLVPVAERVFSPIAIALRSVPIIVLTPLLILAFGRDLWGVAAITTIVTFFPTLANIQAGLRRVPAEALTLMRSYDGSVFTTLWRVQLPFTWPAIFASARIAAPSAVLAATLAEWLATGDGLGYLIVISRAHSQYVGLWAGAAVLTAISLVFYSVVSAGERAVLKRYAPDHVR